MKKEELRLKKVFHRGDYRIAIYFPYSSKIQKEIQKIGGKWSKTLVCWYVDYGKLHYQKLINLGWPIVLPNGKYLSTPKKIKKDTKAAGCIEKDRENPPIAKSDFRHPEKIRDKAGHKPNYLTVEWYQSLVLLEDVGKYWVFKMRYCRPIVKSLLSIKGVCWNKTHKAYMAYKHPNVREAIHALFEKSDFLPEVSKNPSRPSDNYAGKIIKVKPNPKEARLMQVYVPKYIYLIDKVKRFAYSQYSKAKDCYLLPATKAVAESLLQVYEGEKVKVKFDLPSNYLKNSNQPKRKYLDLSKSRARLLGQVPKQAEEVLASFLDRLMALNYSNATIRNYGGCMVRFMRDFGYKDPAKLSQQEVIRYLAGLMQKGLSSASGHSMVNALKFYYGEVLNLSGWQLTLPRPKKEKRLPVVLSMEECRNIFRVVKNPKHKLLLLMGYGAGLRVSELVNLRWVDLDLPSHRIHVKQAKGKKDRIVMLPRGIVDYLLHYKKAMGVQVLDNYVFEGQVKGEPYSVRSVQ